MRGERIPGDGRPRDLTGEDQRRANNGETVMLLDDDRQPRVRLAQALSRAGGEHPRAVPLRKEVERRCAMDGSRHPTSIGAIDLHGQMVGGRVLLESRSASIELEDGDVRRCHRATVRPAGRGAPVIAPPD